jgi:HTH-type transcriptional repressor of NAD biosynthesis genes
MASSGYSVFDYNREVEAGHSWVLLTGSLDERMDLAARTVDQLLAVRARFAEPLLGPGFAE